MRRGFGFVGLLGVLLIAGISGVIGYNMGLSAGLTSAGAATAVVVAPWGLGFGPFGFLFGILFFFLIIGLIGRLLFGGRRHGHGFGPGGPWRPGLGRRMVGWRRSTRLGRAHHAALRRADAARLAQPGTRRAEGHGRHAGVRRHRRVPPNPRRRTEPRRRRIGTAQASDAGGLTASRSTLGRLG